MRFKLKLMSGRLKRKMYEETSKYSATQGHPCREGEEPKGVVLRVQRYTGKSIILWKVWFQKLFHKYVEYDHPGELSHYRTGQSLLTTTVLFRTMFTRTIILNLLINSRYVLRLTMEFYSSDNDSKSNFISSENQPLISSINFYKDYHPSYLVVPLHVHFAAEQYTTAPSSQCCHWMAFPPLINIAPSYFPVKIICRRKIKRKEIHNYLIPCPS